MQCVLYIWHMQGQQHWFTTAPSFALPHPVLPSCCIDALVPQRPHVVLFVAPVCVGVLQCLLSLLPSYLDAVFGPASEALGDLPHSAPVQAHGAVGSSRVTGLVGGGAAASD